MWSFVVAKIDFDVHNQHICLNWATFSRAFVNKDPGET